MRPTSTHRRNDAPPQTLNQDLKVVRMAGWLIGGVGVVLVGFVLHQLFLTTWLAEANQDELTRSAETRFASVAIDQVPYPPQAASTAGEAPGPPVPDPVPTQPTLLVEPAPARSEPFAIIRAPSLARLSEGWTVVEGVGVAELKTGAGHMPDTPLPGMPGNAVISGHRTTYGAPFNEIDRLQPGDLIVVETATGAHHYTVRRSMVVSPLDVWVSEARPGAWLTLTTCHPEFSARQRLVVFAELTAGPNREAIYG